MLLVSIRRCSAAAECPSHWLYLSQGVPLHVLHGSLLVLLLQGVQVWLVQEGGAGVDRVVLQVGGRASASIDRRPQARLLQDLCREKHTEAPAVKVFCSSLTSPPSRFCRFPT